MVTPTVYVSGKVPGTAYVGAISGSTGKLYKTTNYGASWVAVNLPASDFGQSSRRPYPPTATTDRR